MAERIRKIEGTIVHEGARVEEKTKEDEEFEVHQIYREKIDASSPAYASHRLCLEEAQRLRAMGSPGEAFAKRMEGKGGKILHARERGVGNRREAMGKGFRDVLRDSGSIYGEILRSAVSRTRSR